MRRWGFSDALAFAVAMTVRDMSREKEKRLIKTQKFYQECYERIANDSEQAFNIVSKVVKKASRRYIPNVYYTHPDYETYLSNKYAEMEQREQRYECIQVEDAEVVLVAYGISSRVCREAVEIAREEGFKLGLIRPITLWPFPVKAFEQAKEAKAFLTVEMNILGQMVDDVKLATGGRYPVDHYGSIFEIPESDGIIAKAKEMLKKGEA